MSTIDLSRERKLRKLAEKLEKLQSEREELDYKIIQTQAEYGALYNKTAPILNLPIEITCRMFELAHHASFVEGVPENPLIEVTISHVCTEWRSVALSFQTLWSNFRYNVSELPKRIPIDRLVAYLKRSGSHLLDLHFTFSESVLCEGSQALFYSMLESTISHVDRWRQFSLFSDVDVPMHGFSDRLQWLKASNLQYLTMCLNSSDPEGALQYFDGLAPSVFLGGAPKLFCVWVDGASFRNYLPPFSNVTVLRLEETDAWTFGSFSLFLEILALPSLSSLSIVGEHFEEPELPHTLQITMNNLKHLRYGEDYYLIGHFLPFLVAPLLETLIIKGVTFPRMPSPLPKYMRPFFNLHSLELIECMDYGGFINSLVTLTPHVINLTIVDDSVGGVLQCVTRPFLENGTKSWPNLKFLTSSSRLDYHPILPYIEFARMVGNPGSKLTLCIDAEDWAFDDPESYQLLKAICVIHSKLPNKPKIVSWPPGVDVPAEKDFFTIEYY